MGGRGRKKTCKRKSVNDGGSMGHCKKSRAQGGDDGDSRRRISERIRNKSTNVELPVAGNSSSSSRASAVGNTEGSQEDIRLMRDSNHLLRIFPEEIWAMLFDEAVKSHPDIAENLSNASPFFRARLLSQRVYFLFPKVFKILGPKFECDIDKNYLYIPLEGMCMGRPILHRCSPAFAKIPKLRSVCSSWTKVVDSFYENHPVHYKMEHDQDFIDKNEDGHEEEGTWVIQQYPFHANIPEVPDDFVNHFEDTHSATDRNPVTGRVMHFQEENHSEHASCCGRRHLLQGQAAVERSQRFWNGISTVLLKVGHHLWHCALDVEDRLSASTAYYERLREWLILMPNLKTLHLTYSKTMRDGVPGCWDRPDKEIDLKLMELTQLEAEVELSPLPKLEHLKFLKTKNLPTPIFNALIASNNHICMLDVDRREVHVGYNLFTVPLPNLSQLSLKLSSEADIGKLESAQEMKNWPLTKLYLPYQPSGNIDFHVWARLLEAVNDKFRATPTLTNVMLQLPDVKLNQAIHMFLKKSPTFKLELPHIKRLKLIMGRRGPVDFLLPLKDSLEKFVLEVVHGHQRDQEKFDKQIGKTTKRQIIKFVGYENKMLESNIWTLLPNLKDLGYFEGDGKYRPDAGDWSKFSRREWRLKQQRQ